MIEFQDIVRGKHVALVGNAVSLLKTDSGKEIDSHDVVIRINLGLPHRIGSPDAIGSKTDIWVAARFWPESFKLKDPKLAVFMKLTAIGDRDWQWYQDAKPHCNWPMIRWPAALADECIDYCKCDPGCGLRILWFLAKKCLPATVDIYGMDAWDTPSNWSGKFNTPNHNPSREKEVIQDLCKLLPSKTSTGTD